MAKVLRCRDVGFDCDAEVRADSTEAVMAQVAQHAREVHGIDEVPDEVAERAMAAIRETPERSS
jgi:predicted small metal-binding protein